jgi:hypothetical protein
MSFAVLDDGVDDGSALSRLWVANEEPILHPQFGWSNRSLGCIIVNCGIWIVKVATQVIPYIEGILHGLVALGVWVECQKVSIKLHFDCFENGTALL